METTLANKIFVELTESLSLPSSEDGSIINEGVVTSLNEFIGLVGQANDIYCDTFKIPDADKLVIAEDIPGEVVHKLNNITPDQYIDANTLRDLRIVTYTADERPAVIGKRKADSYEGFRNVKWRLVDITPDPEYTGYSIAKFIKEIETDLSFHVWGVNFEDIRKRGALLRNIIDTNIWFFKHKGLRDIIWQDGEETRLWDGKNLVKQRIERYLVRYAELKIVREKNLEQIVVALGVEK